MSSGKQKSFLLASKLLKHFWRSLFGPHSPCTLQIKHLPFVDVYCHSLVWQHSSIIALINNPRLKWKLNLKQGFFWNWKGKPFLQVWTGESLPVFAGLYLFWRPCIYTARITFPFTFLLSKVFTFYPTKVQRIYTISVKIWKFVYHIKAQSVTAS